MRNFLQETNDEILSMLSEADDLDALRTEELKFFKEIAMKAQALKDLADKYNTWLIKNDLQELVNHQSQKLESQARSNLERVLQII